MLELCLRFNAVMYVQALRNLGVCYDEIVFGNPVADGYIAGGVDNVHEDMEKEVFPELHACSRRTPHTSRTCRRFRCLTRWRFIGLVTRPMSFGY